MLKQKITALCAAVVMSSAVLADDLSIQPVSNAFDESKVFEIAPNQSLNAVELSESQMKETEGENLAYGWLATGAIIGGVGGAGGYLLECEMSPRCDLEMGEFAKRGAWGAIKGAPLGPMAIWRFNKDIATGTVKGVWDNYR